MKYDEIFLSCLNWILFKKTSFSDVYKQWTIIYPLQIIYKHTRSIVHCTGIKKTGLMHSQQKNLENNLTVNQFIVRRLSKFFLCLPYDYMNCKMHDFYYFCLLTIPENFFIILLMKHSSQKSETETIILST